MSRRIAIFLSSLEGGGAHKNMIHVAEGLSNNGHEVDLVVATERDDLSHLIPEHVEIHRLGCSRVRYSPLSLLKYIRANDPDALLATPAYCTVIAGLLDWIHRNGPNTILRVPVTLTNEQFFTDPDGFVERVLPAIIKRVYSKSNFLIAISEGVKDDLVSNFGVNEEKIEVIYNPAITDRIDELMTEEVDHPFFEEDDPVFVGVGRLTEQKNFSYLLRAFDELLSSRGANLIILGQGDLEKPLKNQCQDLSISDSVSFPGFVDNPYKYMYNADVFVLSSAWEGFGNVVAEALACKTPVVATDCESGPAEILDGGKYGYLAPTDDVNYFAEKMKEALKKECDEELLRNRAREFHVDNIVPQYESCILRGL